MTLVSLARRKAPRAAARDAAPANLSFGRDRPPDGSTLTPDHGSLGSSTNARPFDPETTIELIQLAKGGDDDALDRLLERCLPPLQRWAHRRLPAASRGMNDTADIVQDAVISAMRNLGTFEPRHQGALQAYLRRAVTNRIRDIIRMTRRRPTQTALSDELKDEAISPLEALISEENAELYDEALDRLSDDEQEAIIGRLEMGYSYQDLAVMLGRPSADAARMAVTRALKHLAREMRSA